MYIIGSMDIKHPKVLDSIYGKKGSCKSQEKWRKVAPNTRLRVTYGARSGFNGWPRSSHWLSSSPDLGGGRERSSVT